MAVQHDAKAAFRQTCPNHDSDFWLKAGEADIPVGFMTPPLRG